MSVVTHRLTPSEFLSKQVVLRDLDGYHAARAKAVETARVALRRAASGASEADVESYDELRVVDRWRILGSAIHAVFVTRPPSSQ